MKITTGKLKSLYLLWLSLNFIFLLTSGNFIGHFGLPFASSYFYPLDGFKHEYYDITEFLIYSLLPISIYYIFRLWKKN